MPSYALPCPVQVRGGVTDLVRYGPSYALLCPVRRRRWVLAQSDALIGGMPGVALPRAVLAPPRSAR